MSFNKLKPLFCILTASVLAVSSPVQAFGFQDLLQDVLEDKLPEELKDSVPAVFDIVGKYLPDSLNTDKVDFDTIQKAIIEFMNSPWYSGASKEERIEEITNLLKLFGIEDSDIIAQNIDEILSFSFQGQEIGIYIEDYTTELFDPSKWEAPEMPEPAIDNHEDLSKSAVIMYGLGYPEIEDYLNLIAEEWTSSGLDTSMDINCSIDDFKTELKNHDLIVIEEHGNYDGYNIPMICTTEAVTATSMVRYADDLTNKRIKIVFEESGTHYWIDPSFFTYYYNDGSLSDSLVWMGCCSGYKTDDLANSFISCGAGSVVGHSDTVYCAYDNDLLRNSIYRMMAGDDSVSALTYAKRVVGENDTDYARNIMNVPSNELKDCTSYPRSVGAVEWSFDRE